MRGALIALTALIVACQTHTIDQCFAPCGASDQTFFARCVADGLQADPSLVLEPGGCLAGNRRCCARATECIGRLDDQTVNTTVNPCQAAAEDQCWPPCGSDAQGTFDLCVGMGNASCAIGDEMCCVLALDCLGTVGDWTIYADGCCSSQADCADGDHCDPMSWMCVAGMGATCGDGVVSGGEDCDDHNDVTESCPYGQMSCTVCGTGCVMKSGTPTFCGDHVIDATNGESCDPPSGRFCDATCHDLTPATCRDLTMDGTETDVDCGGRECAPCTANQHCLSPSDCRTTMSECNGVADCLPTGMLCVDTAHCDDTNVCTRDTCAPGTGCSFDAIDDDLDGVAPLDIGCGMDCDDHNAAINPSATEVCDGIDNNCNDLIDETC